ncbi:MAG TPA: TMEM143 family protein, partial [Hyphomicrobiaceae bacterium]|nr:TMEM143 family protein [Hyphomicrobiaceae bacterium]
DRDGVEPDETDARERFLPITRFALIERLTQSDAWSVGTAGEARRFFRYLEYWRRQQYNAALLDLEQCYEPFSPDTDLLVTSTFTDAERKAMQKRVVGQVERLLQQANYVRIDPAQVEMIITKDSHYGLDLHVDLKAFEELLIYCRGASKRKDQRRVLRKFLRKEQVEVPIFRRLFVLFKLKPEGLRIEEVMNERRVGRSEAEKIVRNLRSLLPPELKDDCIYLKLFKDIPRSDIEMVFPNTRVRFRLLDKIKLGLTGGAGVGVSAFSAAGKIALAASNPVAAAGAVAGLGGIAFRQCMNFMNQRQRYMVILARNLYFHAMADNRGVIIKLANRAAEEDVKEEMLLYAALAKKTVSHRDLPAIDKVIEADLLSKFGVAVNFDLEDALQRLIADGIVIEEADGTLRTLPPAVAALHLDRKWDEFLDKLPDRAKGERFAAEASSKDPVL